MSRALDEWRSDGVARLDEVAAAHLAIGGTGSGRRTTTQQVNNAYIVILASQFQAFARNLHTEAANILATTLPLYLRSILLSNLTSNRQLDRGNAQSGSLGADFGRLGMAFWNDVYARDARNQGRRHKLDQLNIWRNAVAHHDYRFTPDQLVILGDSRATLNWVRNWRSGLEALAGNIDDAVREYLVRLTGAAVW
jgi:hypothetical protein